MTDLIGKEIIIDPFDLLSELTDAEVETVEEWVGQRDLVKCFFSKSSTLINSDRVTRFLYFLNTDKSDGDKAMTVAIADKIIEKVQKLRS